MLNLDEMIQREIQNGYSSLNARAKVCQDIVLKSIASGNLSRNITVKGGVVMRSKSGNVRRATQDLDLDFIRYSLSDESIDAFIEKMNCIDGLRIQRVGNIDELKQQEYKGKRVYIEILDEAGFKINSKIDLGVHSKLDVAQEEYCFDIAFDDEGANLLINSNEQMFVEKLRSLLKLGPISTRYKDVFDMFYLSHHVDLSKLKLCMDAYIFSDNEMHEKIESDIVNRIQRIVSHETYLKSLSNSNKNWLDEPVADVVAGLVDFLKSL